MAKTVGVIALKGGVGKTTTVSNLGAILATYFKKKVLLVDANFNTPNLALHYGIYELNKTLHDVLLKRANIKEAIYEIDSNLSVLPSSYISRKINPFLLKNELKKIKDSYDIVLIDSSPSLNEEILATMVASDELLVITSADYPSLSATLRATRLAKQKKTPIKGLLINKVRKKRFELSISDIEKASGVPVVAVLPDDIKILEALSLTSPAALVFPRSSAVKQYKKLAAFILGKDIKEKESIINRLKRIFSKEIPKDVVNREILLHGVSREESK